MAEKYHGKQVKLYAEYAPKKLLPFLKSSTHYPLQMALEECEMRNLIPEQVFLLGLLSIFIYLYGFNTSKKVRTSLPVMWKRTLSNHH